MTVSVSATQAEEDETMGGAAPAQGVTPHATGDPRAWAAESQPTAGGDAAGARPSLELTTQFAGEEYLRQPIQGEWRLRLNKDASEAGGSFLRAPRIVFSQNRGVRGMAADPDRAAAMAARRAGSRLRRYVVANRLNRLGTLTYAEACFDERQVRRDVGDFFRKVKSEINKPFPYLWVPEWHGKGHGLHMHFVVGRYVKRATIDNAWGRGFVHIKLLGQVPIGHGSLGESRRAAGYIGKYLRKGFEGERAFNLRRFDVARGFAPKSEVIIGRSAHEVATEASRRMGGAPTFVWRSIDQEGWIGPNAMWMTWDQAGAP
jgi:hypothetical protein